MLPSARECWSMRLQENQEILDFNPLRRAWPCPTLSSTNCSLAGKAPQAESLFLRTKSNLPAAGVTSLQEGEVLGAVPGSHLGFSQAPSPQMAALWPPITFSIQTIITENSWALAALTQDRWTLTAPEHHRGLIFWRKPSPNGSHLKHGLSHFFPEDS